MYSFTISVFTRKIAAIPVLVEGNGNIYLYLYCPQYFKIFYA